MRGLTLFGAVLVRLSAQKGSVSGLGAALVVAGSVERIGRGGGGSKRPAPLDGYMDSARKFYFTNGGFPLPPADGSHPTRRRRTADWCSDSPERRVSFQKNGATDAEAGGVGFPPLPNGGFDSPRAPISKKTAAVRPQEVDYGR